MPLARTRFAQIEYEEHGSPGHTPLILLHGFPDSFRTWDRVIDNLKGEPLRVLVPHLRGFGATRIDNPDALSGQTGAFAQDVLDFADAVGIARFVLVGHDWGARTAYAVAVLAHQRLLGLVTLATPYLMFQGKRESRASSCLLVSVVFQHRTRPRSIRNRSHPLLRISMAHMVARMELHPSRAGKREIRVEQPAVHPHRHLLLPPPLRK